MSCSCKNIFSHDIRCFHSNQVLEDMLTEKLNYYCYIFGILSFVVNFSIPLLTYINFWSVEMIVWKFQNPRWQVQDGGSKLLFHVV